MPATRFIVPFGFEGAADRAARAFARSFAPDAQEIDIENVPGAGGLAGVRRANALAEESRAPVLLLATPSTHVLLPLRLGHEAALDNAFAPVLGLGFAPNVLLVSPRLGVRTVGELVARAKAEELVYASAGAGQTIHVCTALFCELAGIRMTHRPFDGGSADAHAELVAGRVHVYFDNLLGCRDAIERGDAVPLAVSSAFRNRLLPNVPTLAECGFREHALDVWFGVFGANLGLASMDRATAARTDAKFSATLAELGLSGGVTGPEALARQVEESAPIWRKALESAVAPERR